MIMFLLKLEFKFKSFIYESDYFNQYDYFNSFSYLGYLQISFHNQIS